jgi:hypothetical protein
LSLNADGKIIHPDILGISTIGMAVDIFFSTSKAQVVETAKTTQKIQDVGAQIL